MIMWPTSWTFSSRLSASWHLRGAASTPGAASRFDEVLFHAEIADDEVLPVGGVLPHEEREQILAVVQVRQRDGFEVMPSPMKSLNSRDFAETLNRVVPGVGAELGGGGAPSRSKCSASPSCCARGRERCLQDVEVTK